MSAFFAGLWGALKALPELLKLISKAANEWIKHKNRKVEREINERKNSRAKLIDLLERECAKEKPNVEKIKRINRELHKLDITN